MLFELMHKDIVVAEIDINDDGTLKKVVRAVAPSHFPYGTMPNKKGLVSQGLSRWWNNRRIPISRNDLLVFLNERAPNASLGSILIQCKGLSLSDCYWIREKGSSESFHDLNFFENGFSYDLGDALVGQHLEGKLSFMSPDITSEGDLKKRWKIIKGKRVLLKSGTPPYRYEIYNEIIASSLLKHLNIPHVDYYLLQDGNEPYCACEDFVDYSQDFVTAYMVYNSQKKRNDESNYAFLIRCYEQLGIESAKEEINKMLLADYLLGNVDRHLNNFGLLRDAKTLRFLGVAPIFDTGSSLGFNLTDEEFSQITAVPWKPFATQKKQTQLDYIDYPIGISGESLFSLGKVIAITCDSLPLSQKRKQAIINFIGKRVDNVIKRFGIKAPETKGLSKTQKRILDYISVLGGRLYLAGEAASGLGISKITVIRNLEALVKKGAIQRIGSKKTGYWELIWLSSM